MKRKIIATSDGSHSIFIPELNEHYHSTHGAIQESKHVFIEAGLKHLHATFEGKEINILEIGLGTGLNALLTYRETSHLSKTIDYTALEAFPLSSELIPQLNHVKLLSNGNTAAGMELQYAFHLLHDSDWNRKIPLSDHFSFK